MAKVDYEAAWVELGEAVASRDGWGSRALAQEMARIAARHRVSESLLARALRLFGGSIVIEVPAHPPGEEPSGDGATTASATAATARPPTDRGGHDGSRTREQASVPG